MIVQQVGNVPVFLCMEQSRRNRCSTSFALLTWIMENLENNNCRLCILLRNWLAGGRGGSTGVASPFLHTHQLVGSVTINATTTVLCSPSSSMLGISGVERRGLHVGEWLKRTVVDVVRHIVCWCCFLYFAVAVHLQFYPRISSISRHRFLLPSVHRQFLNMFAFRRAFKFLLTPLTLK